jgi:hypothetical protein
MKLTHFKVTNYRNIWDSRWIDINDISAFVGQNEAGKSNLFEALYRINPFAPNEAYNIDEDWPVDDWGNKDPSALVCEAKFALAAKEIESLYDEVGLTEPEAVEEGEKPAEGSRVAESEGSRFELPAELILVGSRRYNSGPTFAVAGDRAEGFNVVNVDAWAKKHIPTKSRRSRSFLTSPRSILMSSWPRVTPRKGVRSAPSTSGRHRLF